MFRRRSHAIRSSGIKACLLLVFLSSVFLFGSKQRIISDSPKGHYLPGYCEFFWADVVIKGVIDSVIARRVSMQDWWPKVPPALEKAERMHPGLGIDITLIRMKVSSVFKGRYNEPFFEFAIGRYDHDLGHNYTPGDSLIVGCEFRDSMLGGAYTLRSDHTRFVEQDGLWVNQGGHGAFRLDEIRERLYQETDVRYFAKAADVIAIVHMGSLKPDTTLYGPKGSASRLGLMQASIDTMLKGSVRGDTLAFRVGGSGDYTPDWRRRSPKLHGGHWIVFLKQTPVGLYPMGGLNGMLRIEGDKLIYDNRIVHPYSKGALKRLVAQEVGR